METLMVSVSEAEKIMAEHVTDYGVEMVPLSLAAGRILAKDLLADRDLPPFNRATVDGIAIQSGAIQQGIQHFAIQGIQAAGATPLKVKSLDHCIEIMTGAAVDPLFDAVIRYEDCRIENGQARIMRDASVRPGLNIHVRGRDKLKGEVVAEKSSILTPALMGVAASIGAVHLQVKKLPKIVVISTGDEMIPYDAAPTAYELRRSNGVVIEAALSKYKIPVTLRHINDDPSALKPALMDALQHYDVLLMTGGVSMGKFDYVPGVLSEMGVQKKFHKIKQRPGKPFWFGSYQNLQEGQREKAAVPAETLIFAFPGNPVSVFMCLTRYFMPWLAASLGLTSPAYIYAVLESDIYFKPALQYFAQVKLRVDESGVVIATPFTTNGSGDFSNLIYADGFMELPMGSADGLFKKGACFKVWRYA